MRVRKFEVKYLKSSFIIELIVSIAAGLSAIFWQQLFVSEQSSFDMKMKLRSQYEHFINKDEIPLDERIVIINIPEDVHIRHNHPAITPRDYMAALIRQLNGYGAAVIGLDYIFDYPSPHDDELLEAIKEAGNVVIGYQRVTTIRGFTSGTTETLQRFSAAAHSSAYLNTIKDETGRVRSYDFTLANEPSFAHELLAAYFGLPPVDLNSEGGRTILPEVRESFRLKKGIPPEFYGRPHYINYSVEPIDAPFIIYSSDELLYSDPAMAFLFSEVIRDRIVIIGEGGYNKDIHKTPFSPAEGVDDTYGVLIQATVLRSFLDRSFIYKSPLFLNILIICFFIFLTAYLAFSFGFLKVLIFAALEIYLYIFISITAFVLADLWLPSIMVTASIFVTLILVILFRIAYSEKDNIDAGVNLVNNIPASTISRFQSRKEESIFLPREQEVVLLACWPKNIPSVSEKNRPEKVVDFLNYYYRVMREVIFAGEGCFNRIPLNGVLAFWNAPLEDEQALEKAIATAGEIMERIALFNQRGRNVFDNFKEISIDLAIHKGIAMTGYFGPDSYRDYTVIGDQVNLTFDIAHSFGDDEESWVVITKEVKKGAKEGYRVLKKLKSSGRTLYRIEPFYNK